MAEKKKSQLELEKSIKKAGEGIELFDAAYSKFSSSSSRNIREKNENELKREIKKLQKLRESLKTAINSGDVKETSALVKTNNEIETRMAKMRNLDKDQRLPDAESQQKNDQMREDFKDWLIDSLKKLQKQASKIPAEKEKHKGPYKTKKIEREKQKKLSELDLVNYRHQFHIKNLNKLLQSFSKNSVNIDELNFIKVHVEDYMTNCEDSEHTFNENFYDSFDMEFPTSSSPAGLTHSNVSALKPKAKDQGQQTSSDAPRKNLKGTTSVEEVHKSISKANSASNERGSIANPVTNASSTNQNNVPMISGTPPTPEKFRDKPVGAVTPSSSQKTRSVKIQSTVSLGSVSSSPHASTEKVKESKLQLEGYYANSTTGPSPLQSQTVEDFSTPSNEATKKVSNKQQSNAASTPSSSKQKSSDKQASGAVISKTEKSASSQPTLFDAEDKKAANVYTPHSISCSDTESVSVATETLRSSKTRLYTTEDVEVLSILERAWANFSNFENTDCHGKNTRLSLTNVQVPAHHRHPHDDNMACPEMFEKYSIETLFFIFYFFQGTQAQLMAGKMLKKRSWGFHTDFMLWFQRHEEPRVITDTYEQGAYKFFDIHTWSLMKKDDFVFEYRYLEGKDF